MIFNGRIVQSGGGGAEFPTLDEVLTWDNFDLTDETDDTSIEDGAIAQAPTTSSSGLHGYMCALVSYMYDTEANGFAMFYLHNKGRAESQPSEAQLAVDENIVVIPVLTSGGSFRIACYSFALWTNGTRGRAWLTTSASYEMTGGADGDGQYSRENFDYPFFKPVVYYKAF